MIETKKCCFYGNVGGEEKEAMIDKLEKKTSTLCGRTLKNVWRYVYLGEILDKIELQKIPLTTVNIRQDQRHQGLSPKQK